MLYKIIKNKLKKMKKNKQIKNEYSEKKHISFFDKIAYPTKYFQQKYAVSQAFIYFVFIFIFFSIIAFIGMKFL
jgi:hypothetical protein